MAEVSIGGKQFPLVHDSLLPAGKRAITRRFRATNTRDPARIRTAFWDVSGPIGNSLESVSGKLATDYTQNLETRHPQRLMSLGKRTAVSLSSANPAGASTSAMFGTSYFATNYFGGTEALFGSSGTSGDIVRFFDELQGYLFVGHGAIETQIGPLSSGWTVVASHTFASIIKAVAHWDSWGWLGFGYPTALTARVNPTSTGTTYVGGLTVAGETMYVWALALGSDRMWFAKSDTELSGHEISYTLDKFVNIAAPFPVGDPYEQANGIGPFGPWTHIGKTNGLFSFTDQGKPVPLSKALQGFRSTQNGVQWADPGWGWNYAITNIGVRAINGGADNPVGVGERMKAFTGHGGRPTAIYAARGEMWIAYLTSSSEAYLYRCVFSDETAGTGQPDLYPARYLTSTEIGAIFSTTSTTNPTIIWGENGNIAYETISRDGRDDTFSSRLYSISGGVWYGTTLDRDPHLLKTLRCARIRVLNLEPCSDWQLAVAFDVEPWHAATYVNVGPLLDIDGYYTLRPQNGTNGGPLDNISGRNFKPKLTQRAEGDNAETLPPEVSGMLEIEYDERPDMIEEVTLLIQAGEDSESRINKIVEMASEQTDGPLKVVIPGDRATRAKYAMVAGEPERKDLKGDGVESIEVVLHIWNID